MDISGKATALLNNPDWDWVALHTSYKYGSRTNHLSLCFTPPLNLALDPFITPLSMYWAYRLHRAPALGEDQAGAVQEENGVHRCWARCSVSPGEEKRNFRNLLFHQKVRAGIENLSLYTLLSQHRN